MVYYKQLTQAERYAIYGLCKAGFTKKEIAQTLERHPATIGREIKRNAGGRGYRPQQAHEKAITRKKSAYKARTFTPDVQTMVIQKLEEQWSPDQISGWLWEHKDITLSHERIYQFVLADKRKEGSLYRQLRHAHRKRKKRYGSHDRRGQIPNRISIDFRPACVDTKARLGDWEADTMIGRNHLSALVTMVERKSKVTLIRKVDRYTSSAVNAAIRAMLHNYHEYLYTITVDNGREFAGHESLAQNLGATIYFAHPYHSWERGLNENTNGLIRQYFPKKTDFRKISSTQIRQVQYRLNQRPRKTLGYLSPNDYFIKEQNNN